MIFSPAVIMADYITHKYIICVVMHYKYQYIICEANLKKNADIFLNHFSGLVV